MCRDELYGLSDDEDIAEDQNKELHGDTGEEALDYFVENVYCIFQQQQCYFVEFATLSSFDDFLKTFYFNTFIKNEGFSF